MERPSNYCCVIDDLQLAPGGGRRKYDMEILRGQRIVVWGPVLTGFCGQKVSEIKWPGYDESLRILNWSGAGEEEEDCGQGSQWGGCQKMGKSG